jgi:hypothetical protein
VKRGSLFSSVAKIPYGKKIDAFAKSQNYGLFPVTNYKSKISLRTSRHFFEINEKEDEIFRFGTEKYFLVFCEPEITFLRKSIIAAIQIPIQAAQK